MILKDYKAALDMLISECGIIKVLSSFGGGLSCAIITTIVLFNVLPDNPAPVKETASIPKNDKTKKETK